MILQRVNRRFFLKQLRLDFFKLHFVYRIYQFTQPSGHTIEA
ncbi:MAG: hypothetical protein ACQEXQ_01385 [Bacillota bacterium]